MKNNKSKKRLGETEEERSAIMPKYLRPIVNDTLRKVEVYGALFESIFHVRLNKYMHPVFGFELIRFDDEIIKPKDGESCRDVVEREYGKKAVDLILELIKA